MYQGVCIIFWQIFSLSFDAILILKLFLQGDFIQKCILNLKQNELDDLKVRNNEMDFSVEADKFKIYFTNFIAKI